MFPEDAPWTEDHKDYIETIDVRRGYPRAFDDEEEFLDALYGVI